MESFLRKINLRYRFLAIFSEMPFRYLETFLKKNLIKIVQGNASNATVEWHQFRVHRVHRVPLAKKNNFFYMEIFTFWSAILKYPRNFSSPST
jgi:hypothetical protein